MKKKTTAGSRALTMVKKHFPNVTEVVDATSGQMVEVTKRDENAAKRRNHEDCAMALACKRERNLDGVLVSIQTAWLVKGRRATRYTLPESVRREVVAFDRGGGFAAGQYRLLAPGKYHRLGERRGGDTPNRNTVKRAEPRHFTDGIRTVLGSKAR